MDLRYGIIYGKIPVLQDNMNISIIKMTANDWNWVEEIYLEGISTGDATFETISPGWDQWNNSHLEDCRFIAKFEDKIVGWAALSPVSARRVYKGVVELSIYVSSLYRNKGIGSLLLGTIIKESEIAGIWTLQAAIFPENKESINLHKKFGFREIGYREKIGKLKGIWRDVILFERRSKII